MPTSTFPDQWSMCKAPQKLPAVTINANRGVNFVNFPNPHPNPNPNRNWQSNSEVYTVGIGRTCYVPQVCLCHRRFFPLLRFVPHLHFEVAISILWRLAICIPRCWHTSSILSHVYTSLPYHVIPYERLERASTIYSGKSIEYMKYVLHVLRSHNKGWRR